MRQKRISLVILFALFFAPLHDVFLSHSYCSTHGEVTHQKHDHSQALFVSDSTQRQSKQSQSYSSSSKEFKHDHCSWVAILLEPERDSSLLVFKVPFVLGKARVLGLFSPDQSNLYLHYPKNSPPRFS